MSVRVVPVMDGYGREEGEREEEEREAEEERDVGAEDARDVEWLSLDDAESHGGRKAYGEGDFNGVVLAVAPLLALPPLLLLVVLVV